MKNDIHVAFTINVNKLLIGIALLVFFSSAYWFSFYGTSSWLKDRVADMMKQRYLQPTPALVLDFILCLVMFLSAAFLVCKMPYYRNSESLWRRCTILSGSALELGLIEGYIYYEVVILTALNTKTMLSNTRFMPIFASVLFVAVLIIIFGMQRLLQRARLKK